ncbi:hypothetical protein B0H11DRAFT_878155 [Mycena galericulata]|nr:hypothetical protein B0H11DRAFT_878155 [Mycena galericulata]
MNRLLCVPEPECRNITSSYRPDETPADVFSEHTWLQGAFLSCVAYGMQAILFILCLHLLWTPRARKISRWSAGVSIYITVMFLLGTLYMAALLEFTQQSFIDARNIPGGPNAYEDIMYSIPIDMLANVTMVVLTWMCDVINIWRCFVIHQASGVSGIAAISLPMLMSLSSLVLGCLWLKQVGTVSASPWDTSGVNYTTPYFATSLALNILVTILIVVRLMLYRHRINQAMGTNHGAQYTSLAAMIIESAAIYSIFSLLFLIPFVIGHPLSQLFIQALSPVQIMSAFLIIFRIAQGEGWSHKTAMTAEGFATQSIGGTGPTNIQIRTTTITTDDRTRPSSSSQESIILQVLKRPSTLDFDRAVISERSTNV